MDSPLVYAVTVNFNHIDVTFDFLDTLVKQTYPNLRLLLVDNGSANYEPEIIWEKYPIVELVRIPKNIGFTGGYNTGIRHALAHAADFVFIISNDTLLAPDTLELLVYAAKPEDAGIVAPLIYYADAPARIWSAGGTICGLSLQMTDNHGRSGEYKEVVDRDFLAGCAMLIKRTVLEKVGIFDDAFFCFFEDMDLCQRIRSFGYRLLLVPQAKIWHKVSVTYGGGDTPDERYWIGRGQILFLRKHAQWWQWLFIIPWRLYSTTKILFRLLAKKRTKAAWAYIGGMWAGLRYQI